MNRSICPAMAAMFGLALTSALCVQVVAQDDLMPEDAMQDVMQSEPSVAADYGSDCCDAGCCGCGSSYAEFQFLYLNSYEAEGEFDGLDSEEGYRLVAGYQGCDGLGVRARYFDIDTVQDQDGDYGLDLWYVDVELTDTFCICNLHGVVSAGYRHADCQVFDDGPYYEFEGDGVTVGVQVERDICCEWGVFGWAQHSYLYGSDDYNDVDNDTISWTEIQLGVQYACCVGGYNAVVRGGVEAQQHVGLNYYAETGLFGWFLSAGVEF